MKNKVKQLIADTVMTAIENGIDVNLSAKDKILYVGDQTWCSGYFAGNNVTGEKVFASATGKPFADWVGIFAHESCHMDQFIEDSQAWKDITLADGKETTDEFFKWLLGEELPGYDIRDLALRSLMVEYDCEKRTVAKLCKYGLDELINIEEYIQQANSYVYFYLYMLQNRNPWPSQGPYVVEHIWRVAPKHFDGDYTVVPDTLYTAFHSHYGAKNDL